MKWRWLVLVASTALGCASVQNSNFVPCADTLRLDYGYVDGDWDSTFVNNVYPSRGDKSLHSIGAEAADYDEHRYGVGLDFKLGVRPNQCPAYGGGGGN